MTDSIDETRRVKLKKRQNSYYLTEEFLALMQKLEIDKGIRANRVIELAVFEYTARNYPEVLQEFAEIEEEQFIKS